MGCEGAEGRGWACGGWGGVLGGEGRLGRDFFGVMSMRYRGRKWWLRHSSAGSDGSLLFGGAVERTCNMTCSVTNLCQCYSPACSITSRTERFAKRSRDAVQAARALTRITSLVPVVVRALLTYAQLSHFTTSSPSPFTPTVAFAAHWRPHRTTSSSRPPSWAACSRGRTTSPSHL